jgi:hypothetical protein
VGERTVFDEFLDAVGDVEVAFSVNVHDVAGSIPSIFGVSVLVEFGFVPVAWEDVWAFEEEFSRLLNR